MKAQTTDNSRSFGTGQPRPQGAWGLVLLVAFAVAALIAVAGWTLTTGERGAAIPGFKRADTPKTIAKVGASLDDIATIRIEGHGQSVVIEHGEGTWRLANDSGYPVPNARIQGLLNRISALNATYVSVDSPPPYKSVGLRQLDDPTGATTQIHVIGVKGGTLANFTVGTSISKPGGIPQPMTAVMVPGDSRIWLVKGNLEISADAADWMDNRLVNVPPDQLKSLTISAPDGTHLSFAHDEKSGEFTVTDGLPPGEHAQATWQLQELAEVLSDVRFLDVRLAKPSDTDEKSWKVEARTSKGINYYIDISPQKKMGAWVTFRAEGTNKAAEKAADQFNADHAHWAYLLNQYVTQKLTVQADDLINTK